MDIGPLSTEQGSTIDNEAMTEQYTDIPLMYVYRTEQCYQQHSNNRTIYGDNISVYDAG